VKDPNAGSRELLRNWDPSVKIPALMLLMFAMAFVRSTVPLLLIPIPAIAAFLLSGISLGDLLGHFRIPLALVLFVSLFIAFFSGETVLLRIGPLHLMREGALQGLGVVVRVACIITVGLAMTATTPLSDLSRSLKRIWLPDMLVDMGVLTGRYIMVIGEDHERMIRARRLRGYRSSGSIRGFFRVLVPTTATLLVRGFKRSERVFSAMRARGYGEASRVKSGKLKLDMRDIILLLVTLALAILLVFAEIDYGS
jgi:cobalt/nickel transport system permease protein